jgi:hypothetical protein
MNEDDEVARAIREHVKLILLRLKAELERHPSAPPDPRNTSVEVEREDDKSRRVDDL